MSRVISEQGIKTRVPILQLPSLPSLTIARIVQLDKLNLAAVLSIESNSGNVTSFTVLLMVSALIKNLRKLFKTHETIRKL